MIDGSEKRNRQLGFELENSHVCEKRSNTTMESTAAWKLFENQLVPPSTDFSSLKCQLKRRKIDSPSL